MLALLACLTAAGIAAKDKDHDKTDDDAPTVSIKNMKFSPKSLTVKVGQTVRWKNADTHDHTVVAEDESFKSDNLRSGDTFSHTFKEAGKFPYACSYHPRMKAEIVVEK
jgi:plastocyanin